MDMRLKDALVLYVVGICLGALSSWTFFGPVSAYVIQKGVALAHERIASGNVSVGQLCVSQDGLIKVMTRSDGGGP